jgi:predicted TIM-barrel fold metal-dependent hydrolase
MDVTGAFDLHIHGGPDIRPRKLSAVEIVRRAREAGMAGVLIKSHVCSTAALAASMEEIFGGIHVFGGICLNVEVGGLNPEAARAAISMGARELWMPTFSAETFRSHAGKPGTGIRILDGRGRLLPAVEEILAEVARAGIILGTGHVAGDEVVPLVRRARELGIEKVLVTHPEIEFLRYPLDFQLELARLGAFFERCAVRQGPEAHTRLQQMAHHIREVGVERNIMTTDYGQPLNPYPVEGLLHFMRGLYEHGITEADLDVMLRKNPAWLVGI